MPRLFTLGRFELQSDDSPRGAIVSTQPKRLALLAYLAVATPRGVHRRDTLLGLFWPELGQDEARRALRQALYHLRQVLGSQAIVARADDQVGLLNDTLWCDVVELERGLDADDTANLSSSVALYQGDFLAGLFIPDVSPDLEEWIERTRSRLRQRAIDAGWKLAEQEEASGHASAAADAARRAHELAPNDEGGLRRLLGFLSRQGRRSEALETFGAFARRRELDGDDPPSPQTRALVDQIRNSPAALDRTETSVSPRPDVTQPLIGGVALRELPPSAPSRTLPAATSAPGASARRPWHWVAVAVGILTVATGAVFALRSHENDATRTDGATLAPRDRVLVADFVTRSRDSTVGGIVAEALRVDLGQSPLIRVMTTAQTRGALRGMERPVEVSLDDSLARAVALREGVKAFVTGDISALGSSYVLSVRVVAALTGDELTALRETARDSADLIDAIDRLSGRLRRQIGETLRAVRADPPLPQVMTGSLEALRLYTRAMNAKDIAGDRATAVRLLEEAIALDPAFATAYRMLGSTYASMAEPGRAERALERAFAHRDRLPLRDRYLTMGSYYRNVTAEYSKAAAAYRSLLELYPTDLAGLNNLGLVLMRERQYAAAESLFRRVLAVDSTIPSVHLGLAEVLTMQARHDAARLTLDDVWRRFPDYPTTELTETYAAAAQHDWPSAQRHIRRRLAQSKGQATNESDALLTLGQIELLSGRLADAERDLLGSMRLSSKEESPGRYYAGAIALAWLELRYRGRITHALERVSDVLARYPLDSIAVADRPYGELAEFLAAAGQRSRARVLLITVERDSAAMRRLAASELHAVRGAVALAEGRGRDAVAEFTQEDKAESCPVCALPDLARAYEQAGDIESAIAAYERYLDTPWIWRFESDAPNLGWSRRRLGELYEQQRQFGKAADQYAKLIALWNDADPQLGAALTDVRARYARLRNADVSRAPSAGR